MQDDADQCPAAASSSVGSNIQVQGNAVGAALVSGQGNTVFVVYGAEFLRGRLTAAAVTDAAGRELGPNPYRGLDAFDETSAAFFFGRESLTRRLLDRAVELMAPAAMGRARLLAVMGPSGSGKSSVARAGLVPALVRTSASWLHGAEVAVLRPGASPVDTLALALARLVTGDSAPIEKQGEIAREIRAEAERKRFDVLSRLAAMRRGAGTNPLVVLVDQFEETYTLCRPADLADKKQVAAKRAEHNAFVHTLLHAASEPGGRVCVVLTLRSDFYGALAEHPALSKAVAASHEIVPAMDRDDLRRAVAEPARVAGRPLDTGTVERVLDEAEVGGGAAVLPLVQYALFQVWEGMHEGMSPAETLAKLGGVGGALAGRADQAMATLSSDRERALARRAFLATVQPGEGVRDTRRRAWLDEVIPAGMTAEEAQRALKPFADERLLAMGAAEKKVADTNGRVWLELPHEALIRHWHTLREWVDAQRDNLRFRGRLQAAVEAWLAAGRPRGSLWRRPDLDLLRIYAERNRDGLTEPQAAFLAASERDLAASERESKRERQLARVAIAAIMALAVMSGVLALFSQNRALEANAARDRALRAQMATLARTAYQEAARGDAVTALLLALQPLVRAPKDKPQAAMAEVERAAYDALLQQREFALLRRIGSQVYFVTFSSDGKRLVTVSEDVASVGGTVRMWDAGSRRELATLRGYKAEVSSIALSPDGTRLATASWDRTARLWDAGSGRELAVLRGHNGGVLSVAFSPDGTRLATASEDRTARLWDTGSGPKPPVLRKHNRKVLSVAFSPDGKRLATASEDGTVRLWDAASEREPTVLREHKGPVSSVTFSPDGTRLATASKDGTARLWDVASGRELAVLRGHNGMVLSVAFSPDGKRLVTASEDRTARLWPVFQSREELVDAAAARLPRCLSPAQKVAYDLAEASDADSWDRRQRAPPCW